MADLVSLPHLHPFKRGTLMVDEVTNSLNREQVVICLCSVDKTFTDHEDL